jgi:hypothetical protein
MINWKNPFDGHYDVVFIGACCAFIILVYYADSISPSPEWLKAGITALVSAVIGGLLTESLLSNMKRQKE